MMLMMSPFQLHQLEVDFASLSIMQLPGKPDITAISLVVATFGYLANKGLRTGVAPGKGFVFILSRQSSHIAH